jgi:predicted DNA-binding protein (MmcQ/YjbR family)
MKKAAKRAPAKKKTSTKQAPPRKKPATKQATREPPATALGDDAALEKVRELCLALPDTKLTMTWGSPHFRVAEKIFCGFDAAGDQQVLGVKLVMAHARSIVKDSRFWPAKYVGKHGWVSMDVTRRKSWGEVAALIRESYELIAPKASLAKLR